MLTKAFFYILIFTLLVIFISEAIVASYSKVHEIEAPDAILFLGSGTEIESPLLKERVQRTLSAHQNYPDANIILSGTPEEILAVEPIVSQLVKDKAQIIIHSQAKRTMDSFEFAKKQGFIHIIIATNDFHIPRSLALAHSKGLTAKAHKDPKIYFTSIPIFIREILGKIRFCFESVFNK